MGRTGYLLVLGGTLACGARATYAGECHGIRFPDQSQEAGQPLVLNGLGMREATIFKVDVYVAALYLATTSTDASAILSAAVPYRLVLHFVRSVDASDIDKAWAEGFEKNAPAQVPELQTRIATLSQWMTDIKSGQILQFSFTPGVGLQVNVNGTMKGTINGDDFAKAFLSIWLGNPPNPEVKTGMLGGSCN